MSNIILEKEKAENAPRKTRTLAEMPGFRAAIENNREEPGFIELYTRDDSGGPKLPPFDRTTWPGRTAAKAAKDFDFLSEAAAKAEKDVGTVAKKSKPTPATEERWLKDMAVELFLQGGVKPDDLAFLFEVKPDGSRVKELDGIVKKLLDETDPEPTPENPTSVSLEAGEPDSSNLRSAADILVDIARRGCELWHTAEKKSFATVQKVGHREHWPIQSDTFRLWLGKEFFDRESSVPSTTGLTDALNTLDGMAIHAGPCCEVALRVAEHNGDIFIDLCDEAWRAVRVTATGWQVVDDPPVRFRRSARMLPLPLPARGGAIGMLRPFLHVTERDWPLVLGCIVATFCPGISYPILEVTGEQGSAKTMSVGFFRSVIDPNTAPTRGEPSKLQDLMIAAENGWLVVFDNLSYLSPAMSDAFCRLSTGGGLGTRTHYKNDEETVFYLKRPIVVTGIESIGTRSDLLDRSVIIELKRFGKKERMTERELNRRFEKVRPAIFGALLDGVAGALKNLPAVERRTDIDWPRMADFSQWAVAAEKGLGLKEGSFLSAYCNNRDMAKLIALDSTPVVAALRAMLKRSGSFEGTGTELLDKLGIGQDTRKKGWPKTARTLSGMLSRLSPNLRAAGVDIEKHSKGRDRDKRDVWCISLTDADADSGGESVATAFLKNKRLKDAGAIERGSRKFLKRSEADDDPS